MDNIAVAIVGLHPVSSKGAPLQADEPRKKAHLAEEIKVKPAGALPVLCPFTAPSLTSRGHSPSLDPHPCAHSLSPLQFLQSHVSLPGWLQVLAVQGND